jgi:hypothetical protein
MDDDDIVDGPFDPDTAEVEYLEPGPVRLLFEVVLDEDTWEAAKRLAELDDVPVEEAVRRAVQAQAKTRA